MTCAECNGPLAGRQTKYCSKPCSKRAWQREHAEAMRLANRRSWQKHRESRLAKRKADPQKVAARYEAHREYYRQNRARILARDKARKAEIREQRLAYMTAYNNRPDIKDRQAAYRLTPAGRAAGLSSRYMTRCVDPALHLESFDPHEVFERDGWTCQKCGIAIDRSLEWPDPLSATIDHVVPVSAGGEHSRANARCLCLRCNTREAIEAKRARRRRHVEVPLLEVGDAREF